MPVDEILSSIQSLGRDASRLIFEDELTSLYNRRYLLKYFEHKVVWQGPKRQSLSLLMIDLDHFKQINDQHGHLAGDQALVHVARLLKEVAGEQNMAIRYAGDEFMVLLPRKKRSAAMQLGEKLLKRCRSSPLELEDGSATLTVSLSVGCASAPEDAQSGRMLIQKADAALYCAKRAGRDRLVNASAITAQDAPQKMALHHLSGVTVVGRHAQLAEVTDAYDEFERGRSRFVIIEGAAGMGKTTFLETIRHALDKKEHVVVKVTGAEQEGFRPYYLLTNILRALVNRRRDKAVGIFEAIGPKEMASLVQVFPHLEAPETAPAEEAGAAAQRQGIFRALQHVIPKLVDSEPLSILIDDLQLADTATLQVFRHLMLRGDVPVFVCGTSLGSLPGAGDARQAPLDRFHGEYHEELRLKKIVLGPLNASDVHQHLSGLFPKITVHEGFEQSLLSISQGNPLILSEVVRKLVLDQKITPVGQQWTLQPLDEGYLPKSLEEIVTQKISALDEESRKLLAHASAFGEDVPVSMLTGSSEQIESKVEEFIERSVELGLISADFHEDDEVIRFLGKRVLDITYGTIQPAERERLHEHVGAYQESLYQRKLLPSASYLAYHFKRSANREKAKRYEQLQAGYNSKIFNADEAARYATDSDEADVPLDPESTARVPVVIRSLLTGIRTVKLYPPESQTVLNACTQVMEALAPILAKAATLKIAQEEEALLINGQRADVSEFKGSAQAFQELLRSVELGTMAFESGLEARELQLFMSAFGQIKPSETLGQRFWKQFAHRQNLKHIQLQQVQYAERGGGDEEAPPTVAAKTGETLKEESRGDIQDIIRNLLSASRNIKIYPPKSRTVSTSLEQLMESLSRFLRGEQRLTLANAGNSLLINGDKIDTSEFKSVADSFLEFLTEIGLTSLTFLQNVPMAEIETFLGRFREAPATGISREFWKEINQSGGCSHILFDEYLYGIHLEPVAAVVEPEPEPEPDRPPAGEDMDNTPFEDLLKAFPERTYEYLLMGEHGPIRKMLNRLVSEYRSRDAKVRERILEVYRQVLHHAPMGFKQDFIKLLADPLLGLCEGEGEPKLLEMAGETLHRMAEDLVPFADYVPAARIFAHLSNRLREMETSKDPRAKALAKVLDRKLDLKTQRLLTQDLQSSDPHRQQVVAQLLGSLGPAVLTMLIEVIKLEDDLRVRHIAAELLAQIGPKAGEEIKRALVQEVTAQGRYRMLEVIDSVTRSLKNELSFALGDENRLVRNAAFRLAERLNDREVSTMLLSHVASEETALATGAIKCLGKLKPAGASETLLAVLRSTRETERAVACCQALGQIGDARSIEALAEVVATKSAWLFGKRYDSRVRTAAAFALGQIPRTRVVQVLKQLLQDPDARVRHIARAFVKG